MSGQTVDVIRCRRCGARVNEEALGCPECGADPRTGHLPEWLQSEQEEYTAYDAPGPGEDEEPSFGESARALPDAFARRVRQWAPDASAMSRAFSDNLAGWLRHWAHWFAGAVATGCIVAFIAHDVAAVSAWPSLWQTFGLIFGVIGVVVGVMIAYGGSPTSTVAQPRRGWSRDRTTWMGILFRRPAALPGVGVCIALFCLPTVIVALGM